MSYALESEDSVLNPTLMLELTPCGELLYDFFSDFSPKPNFSYQGISSNYLKANLMKHRYVTSRCICN